MGGSAMQTEVLSVAQKRRAIERGLSHFIESTKLEKVLNYWEEQYSDKPSFVLNRFLSEICYNDELRLYRKDMLKHVLSELSAVEKQVLLKKKPDEKRVSSNLLEEAISFDISDAFLEFLQAIMQQVQTVDHMDFNHEVKQNLQEMGLAVQHSSSIDTTEFSEFLPITIYADVLTCVYQVFCEFYGPTRADSVYARIKQQIKSKYPEVDLHQLL